jgi:hypothetical protein
MCNTHIWVTKYVLIGEGGERGGVMQCQNMGYKIGTSFGRNAISTYGC